MAMKRYGEEKDAPAVTALEGESELKTDISPTDQFKEDILVSLKQVRSGDVLDSDQSLRDIRRELG